MLRNSTRQFRERYENAYPHPYTATGILSLRITRDTCVRPKMASPSSNNQPSLRNSPALRKLEKTTSTANRTLQIKTKQSMGYQGKQVAEKSSGHHRRELTAPVISKQQEQQSETSITTIKWKHKRCDSTIQCNPKEFINSLPKNSVFYCCTCFQYVFEIQKQRHFPDCKDALDLTEKFTDPFRKVAWDRLERISELAKYAQVKSWEVEQLYKEIKSNQFAKIFAVSYPKDCKFFNLDEILAAFVYTYERLLKGAVYKLPPFFTCY